MAKTAACLLLIISGSNERYSKQCYLHRITVVLVVRNLLIVKTFCCQAFLVAILIISRFDFSTVVGFSSTYGETKHQQSALQSQRSPGAGGNSRSPQPPPIVKLLCLALRKQFPVGIAGKDRHC
jgi:hypothetical protein